MLGFHQIQFSKVVRGVWEEMIKYLNVQEQYLMTLKLDKILIQYPLLCMLTVGTVTNKHIPTPQKSFGIVHKLWQNGM
jgi:hypothetical protein